MRRARRASLVVRADREATLDLEDGAEGGTDYSGILAGARFSSPLSCHLFPECPSMHAPMQ